MDLQKAYPGSNFQETGRSVEGCAIPKGECCDSINLISWPQKESARIQTMCWDGKPPGGRDISVLMLLEVVGIRQQFLFAGLMLCLSELTKRQSRNLTAIYSRIKY